MKKLSFLAFAAAGLLLGACTSTDDVVTENQSNSYGLVEGESSWIAVGISMPGDPITRANEDLTDGDATEYAVYSGTLYLFKGANENDATFFGSYPINATFANEEHDNVPGGNSLGTAATGFGEITSSSTKMVQEITNPNLGVNDKLYAYVILNDSNATGITATVNSTTGAQFKTQQLKAIGIADESKGFGDIYTQDVAATATVPAHTKGGLVMTNVPIATAAGGDQDPAAADILTFTEIDKNAIYKTKAEAQADGAQMACIYVERAAVKVEVKLASGFGIQLDGESSVTTISANDVHWALGNVNYGGSANIAKGYYNTRQFDTNWLSYNNQQTTPAYLKYRMVGRTPFFTNSATVNHTPDPAYRTYFGKDPNYTGTGAIPYDANTGLLNAQLSDDQYTLNPDGFTYTYENTFDENSQIYRNTTYVGVKVKIANDAFYTIQGQPNTKLGNNEAIKAVVKTRLRDVINQKVAAIREAIDADLGKDKKSVNPSTTRTISDDITAVTFDYDITVAEGDFNATTGVQPYTVTGLLTNVKTNNTTPSDEDAAAINALAGTNIGAIANPANSTVYKYVGGIAYYSARIQHFGDVETPWNARGEAYNVYQHATNPCVYPANGIQWYGDPLTEHIFGTDHANAWLGRWGIVRNNWYVLTLNKITGIGSPVPEDFSGEAGNTPDDNPPTSYFISAEVHILPWVKRTQSVTF